MKEKVESRFGHHPDPVTDFCVEVQHLMWLNHDVKVGRLGADPDELYDRVSNALDFNVGGDKNAAAAKAVLRRISLAIMTRLGEEVENGAGNGPKNG